LQRYKILFISGNYSRILSRLNRNITEQDVRRAFTSFQLMTILEENRHSFLIVEHDPLLYEDFWEMVGYLAQTLKQTSREATILLYAPALDPHLEKMTELADRVFCIYNEPAGAKGRGRQRRGWPESRGRWRRTREKSATPFLPPRHYRKVRGEFREWLKQEVAKAAEDHGCELT
jgi:hypothetical protein